MTQNPFTNYHDYSKPLSKLQALREIVGVTIDIFQLLSIIVVVTGSAIELRNKLKAAPSEGSAESGQESEEAEGQEESKEPGPIQSYMVNEYGREIALPEGEVAYTTKPIVYGRLEDFLLDVQKSVQSKPRIQRINLPKNDGTDTPSGYRAVILLTAVSEAGRVLAWHVVIGDYYLKEDELTAPQLANVREYVQRRADFALDALKSLVKINTGWDVDTGKMYAVPPVIFYHQGSTDLLNLDNKEWVRKPLGGIES